MQIQRVIEESTSVCGEARGHPKVAATMRDDRDDSKPAADSPARKFAQPAAGSEANGSFLHGTETTTPNVEKSLGDKIVYATIDRLALKRTRLPLQLVPIDDDDDTADADADVVVPDFVEKKERINGDKRVNGSRKTSPRRPSFKVRPGGVPASSVQWKSRAAAAAAAAAAAVRPSPRVNHMIGKFESASVDLASRLAMFENIIRNGDAARDGPTFAGRGVTAVAQQPGLDHRHQEVPETVTSRDKHSSVIHRVSPRDSSSVSEEIADARRSDDSSWKKKHEIQAATCDSASNESNVSHVDSGNEDVDDDDVSAPRRSGSSSPATETTDGPSDRNDEYFVDAIARNRRHHPDSSSTSTSDSGVVTRTADGPSERHDEYFEPVDSDVVTARNRRHHPESSSTSTSDSGVVTRTTDGTSERHDEYFEPVDLDVVTASERRHHVAKTTKRHKREFTFAKNVLHYVPMASHARRSKKSSVDATKNRENSEATKTSLETGRSVSREDLRHSISLPTNFVHLASGDSRVIRDFENTSSSSAAATRVITHEEKCATLRYLGKSNGDEVAKVAGKIVRNSRGKTERRSVGNFTETAGRSGGDEETSGCCCCSTTPTTSSSSSSSSLSLPSDDNVNRAKVTALENSQGAPEVVKRSENEGSRREHAERKTEQVEAEEDDGDAPVYEAMSQFSISTSDPRSPVAAAISDAAEAASRANSSFLWGGRASRIHETGTTGCGTGDETTPSGRGDDDNSLEENDRDAYDDVGLSRDDTEEVHYDDVGLPCITKNSSTDTLFEEIGDGGCELYDDVLPGPIAENSKATSNITSVDCSDLPAIKLSSAAAEISESTELALRKRPSSLSLENADEESNAYSSVEEGLNDFAGEEDDGLYDDVELPSQERVNSLYAGSSSGSQLGSLYNGKESEWEDLEEAAPAAQPSLLLPKKINVVLRNGEAQAASSKKKSVQRWSRKVRRQKSKASRKNSAMRAAATRGGTSTFSDTASDDSNYETLFSYPSDEFSSSDDEESPGNPASPISDDPGLRVNGTNQEAPSRPVPPPPRESSLTESFGKRMKMLRRTWSITKGSLGRMRRRTSSVVEPDASLDDGVKYANGEHHHISNGNDGKKYFSFKKHFKKTGLSTFYLDNENAEDRLSRNNNCSKEEVYSDGSNNSWYTNTDYWKTGVVEQSRRNEADHYSMLDEEPLYQFYAAAAARVAFESDSEGYEEVEDPTPTPSAVDLAKPGHRTLWCQTPQVIGSALLQRLTPDEKKMQEAKFEIFTSEASYLNSLRVLVDEFLNDHELVHEILTPSEREKLFGGVPSVLLASERLLAELETVWREDVMFRGLPEVLLNYAQRSASVYVAYCSNQVSIDTTLKELRSKKGSKFMEAVRRIESHPVCQSLSLHSFLMLPMQRVTRLPLLADAVLSKVSSDNKDERTCWECVLSQLSQVVMECNEGARAAGRLAEMEALERILEYSSKVPPIVLRDRYLVRRGPVVQMLAKSDAEYKLTFGKKHHKASLYLLLLTDYLLVAKPKLNANEETYTVIDTCKRSLVALEKVTEDSPFAGRHAMVLTLLENHSQRHVEYILTCKNATERERWLDAISPPKPSLVGETLYETWDCPQVMALYPYAAAQPDELTLQPGDVINVLRKMTDGWHLGEKLLGGEQGWFPGNYAKEVASEHVRARNLRQRHRLLALSASVLQQRAKLTAR